MKRAGILILTSLALIAPNVVGAQVAGSTLIGVAEAELRDVATGWSAKRQVLGSPSSMTRKSASAMSTTLSSRLTSRFPTRSSTPAIFLHIAKHDVAVPVSQLKLVDGKLVLPGATRDALQASSRVRVRALKFVSQATASLGGRVFR